MYKLLETTGLDFKYEPLKVVLQQSFKLKTLHYKKGKLIKTIREITYTPDFVVYHNNITAYIEVKGFQNDSYPLKKKLFLNWLEKQDGVNYFFEVYNKTDLINAINIIKENDN